MFGFSFFDSAAAESSAFMQMTLQRRVYETGNLGLTENKSCTSYRKEASEHLDLTFCRISLILNSEFLSKFLHLFILKIQTVEAMLNSQNFPFSLVHNKVEKWQTSREISTFILS